MKRLFLLNLLLGLGGTSAAIAQLSIPSGAELYVSNADDFYSKEPVINAGTITLGTGTLICEGNFTNTGTLNLSTAALQFSGSTAQTIAFNSADLVKTLLINNPLNVATVNLGMLNVTSNLHITAGTLASGSHVTLKSNANTTAIVDASAGVVTGIIVERYLPAKRAYRFVSAPVTTNTSIRENWQEAGLNPLGFGTQITGSISGANGFDISGSGNPSLYTFNNATQAWVARLNTNTNTLVAGYPYRLLVRGDRSINLMTNATSATNTTLRATGDLAIGTINISGLSPILNGYSYIGNPYQAAVDMNAVLARTTNVNKNYYYVWDPTINTQGSYVTGILGSNLNNVLLSKVNKYLQPGQACFVLNTATAPVGLSFTEADKFTTTNELVFKTSTSPAAVLQLTLYDSASLSSNGSPADGMLVLFDASNNNAVDDQDARKLANMDETFSSINTGISLSVESRATAQILDEIPLKITQYRTTNYTLVATGTNLVGEKGYLLDQLTQIYTEIPKTGTVNYPFTVATTNTASTAADRFKIVFQNKSLHTVEPDWANQISMYPNPSTDGKFTINIPSGFEGAKLNLNNELGQELYQTILTTTAVKVNPNRVLASGIYFVKIEHEGKTTTRKLIIQ